MNLVVMNGKCSFTENDLRKSPNLTSAGKEKYSPYTEREEKRATLAHKVLPTLYKGYPQKQVYSKLAHQGQVKFSSE